MLELRPTCEHCRRPLPPEATDAMICSFECTFCTDCVNGVLGNVCPNCAGGFAPRPIRPAHDWKGGNYLGQYAASGRDYVDRPDISPAVRDLVKQYFQDLEQGQ